MPLHTSSLRDGTEVHYHPQSINREQIYGIDYGEFCMLSTDKAGIHTILDMAVIHTPSDADSSAHTTCSGIGNSLVW